MTRRIAVGAALVSICAIVLVLRWGISGRAGTPSFELAVHTLSIATPLASVLLTWLLVRGGRRGIALFGATPIMVMMMAVAFTLAGAPFSLAALLWLDVYVLLVFVVILAAFGRDMVAGRGSAAAR